MWRCSNCGAMFDEPELEPSSYEDYYGVSSMFTDRHDMMLEVCPCCQSEDIRSYCEEADDDGIFEVIFED